MRFLCINTTDKSPHNVLSQMILEERRAGLTGKVQAVLLSVVRGT